MERFTDILSKVKVPTQELKLETIQELLVVLKKNPSNGNKEVWNNITEVLWGHLITGLNKLDDQLLCATCFYSVLILTDQQDLYLNKLLSMIHLKYLTKENSNNLQLVSLMYGIFQSSYLIQKDNDASLLPAVLKSIFDLLLLMGNEYSQYTFLIFKTMKSFRKVCSTVHQDIIFSRDNKIKLLNFINHNWENPVTGVRDTNRFIFQTLISLLDDATYEKILKEINIFYWNKAKYLMLSEIIESCKGNLCSLINKYKWSDGLIYSIYKPGLVSAGADMYYGVLKQIKSEDEWSKIFLHKLLNMLNGSNYKAIENFNNYWFLTTVKKFPGLIHEFIHELNKIHESDQILMSKLYVVKQGKKLNIIQHRVIDEGIKSIVLRGLEHCNTQIRGLAFDIVCLSPAKLAPSEVEYELMLDYFHNNVNCDNTVLRLSMINSFNMFLSQLHATFLNVLLKSVDTSHIQDLLGFSKKLQEFILNSFNVKGNYQRKITVVKLCNTVVTNFTEIPKKKKDQTRQATISLLGYLKEKGCWLLCSDRFIMMLVSLLKDPSDDVRENVAKLLLNHYSEELRGTSVMKYLINDALISMQSKYFYEISCGQTMFKLITSLLIKEKHSTAQFSRVEDIFYFAYNQLVAEQDNKDIMQSIEKGKQLHSFMSILIVVLEVCFSSSYKLDIQNIMPELLRILESVSNQFCWEQDSSTSSDFSKMSDMVETIVAKSGFNSDDSDQTKISGLHQMVLNCLWLNVKASCDLAAILVKFNESNIGSCETCLNIITHVLETSRHKGAIEAAGSALGCAIQYLTYLPEENKVSEVPYKLLTQKLNDLISETNKMSSITRRGAGLTIMVHRIVSSDMKKGKPLFHYFIRTLLKICNVDVDTNDVDLENQVDLPKAIYIHFMTRIVTDSSLASDLMYYSASLAELAFGNLTSPHWQIRNAALQLYGALIPRQIGQKKASGSDEETIATVACDELRTHSPSLWNYIFEQLKQKNSPDILQCHSNLVPILNLLASSAKRYNFTYDLMEQKAMDDQLLKHLAALLGSPIHTVRRLTAKCIFNIFDFDDVFDLLMKQSFASENLIHGSLILLNLCKIYYGSNELYENNFKSITERIHDILCSGTHSYLSRKLFEDIYPFYMENNLNIIEETISEMNSNIDMPGVHIWAEARLKKYIQSCSWRQAPCLLKILLQQSDYEKYCELIYMKLETQSNVEIKVILKIVDILLSFKNKYQSSIIWKIIYEMSLKIDLSKQMDVSSLIPHIGRKDTLYRLRYSIPLTARIIEENQDFLIKCIEELSDFENSDVNLRYIAALANNELAIKFDNLPDFIKVTSLKCEIMLLQDEDEDVRNLSVEFYKRLSKQHCTVQPYICLTHILNKEFLYKLFHEPKSSIDVLCSELAKLCHLNHAMDQYNPFKNDSKNIYFEPDVLKLLLEKI